MPALIMILPPGAFITLGIILAVFAHIRNKRKEKKGGLKNGSIQRATGPITNQYDC